MYTAILLLPLLSVVGNVPPDVLVVCPAEFQPAIAEWKSFRESEGHSILVIDQPGYANQLHAGIRRVATGGRLKYVVIMGDVPTTRDDPARRSTLTPTNYFPAKINVRWGSEPRIASDTPYGDVDGDGIPELAVGRIPADSPAELEAALRKVLRYERATQFGPAQRKLNVVCGAGGFGPLADAIINAAGRQVIQQTVPPEYEVEQTLVGVSRAPANATSAQRPATDPRVIIRNQLSNGPLAWIYLGHGLPTELDTVSTPSGDRPLLSVRDVPSLTASMTASPQGPLAVLVACYAGAVDAPTDCLAEELMLAPGGPVAVIAATRVTMPYGNTIIGCELLRATFHEQSAVLGDIMRLAQVRTLADSSDSLRRSLDSMASTLSPAPVDLGTERAEHVLMYQLLGDPLLQLHLNFTREARASGAAAVAK